MPVGSRSADSQSISKLCLYMSFNAAVVDAFVVVVVVVATTDAVIAE